MRTIVQRLALLALICSVAGGHWSMLQGLAYVQMFAKYLPVETLGGALERTFDGREPCQVCQWIEADRQGDQADSVRLEINRVDWILEQYQVT